MLRSISLHKFDHIISHLVKSEKLSFFESTVQLVQTDVLEAGKPQTDEWFVF